MYGVCLDWESVYRIFNRNCLSWCWVSMFFMRREHHSVVKDCGLIDSIHHRRRDQTFASTNSARRYRTRLTPWFDIRHEHCEFLQLHDNCFGACLELVPRLYQCRVMPNQLHVPRFVGNPRNQLMWSFAFRYNQRDTLNRRNLRYLLLVRRWYVAGFPTVMRWYCIYTRLSRIIYDNRFKLSG